MTSKKDGLKDKPKDKNNKKKTGRPTKYTKAVGNEICESVMMGKSLRATCRSARMPCIKTVMNWLRLKVDEEFLQQYARAREIAQELSLDKIIDICDSVETPEMVQAAKLRIDTRKWVMERMAPKKYGKKESAEPEKETQQKRTFADLYNGSIKP